ncbi:exonuclease 1, partial [Tanacetum coccineum]
QELMVRLKLAYSSYEHLGETRYNGYNWLNLDIRECYQEINDSELVAAIKYVNKFMARVNELTRFDIEPYIVFQGVDLPIKDDTMREIHQATHGEVYAVIHTLKREKVCHIVAPYEANPQLAYLCLKGHADAILTHDYDLIAY